ncbi:MAG TPA: hypothetical protein VF862_12030 [Gemmatimonadales bacterium]
MTRYTPFLLAMLAAACVKPSGEPAACGITALAGATMLLDNFSTPQTALSVAPVPAPAGIPVRLAAGPAYRGLVTLEADTTWTVAVEGELPSGTVPGFAVLVASTDGLARGVMLYTGEKVRGAPLIGRVTMGALTLPLIGLQADVAGLEDPQCPFFPDSLARP